MKVTVLFTCVVAVTIIQNVESSESGKLLKRETIIINNNKDDNFSTSCQSENKELIFAKYLAEQIKGIENKEQRIYCEYLIHTVIYKASLGTLTRESQVLDNLQSQPIRQDSSYYPPVRDTRTEIYPEVTEQISTQRSTTLAAELFSSFTTVPDIPPEEKQRLKAAHEFCQNDPRTLVDEEMLRKLRVYRDVKKVQLHMFCMAVHAGLVTVDGAFNENFIKSKIGILIKGEGAVNEVYNKCALTKPTKEETVTYFWLCLLLEGTEYYHKL